MKRVPRAQCFFIIVFVVLGLNISAQAQQKESLTPLRLENLEAFASTAGNWRIAGGVFSDRSEKHHLSVEPGTGLLVNQPTDSQRDNLQTKEAHGDMVLEFDVLMPKGSNSGVYFQGRYELQLLDSWGVKHPTYGDMGGIYHRWNSSQPKGKKGYQGHPPRTNVSRAPGLWQHFRVVFRAPRFDESGHKTQNASFLEVVHNGVVIHKNVELTGPTRGGKAGEKSRAPIVVQGDHGPIAFRNIRYKYYDTEPIEQAVQTKRGNPIAVASGKDPLVFQGFVPHPEGKQKTFPGLPVVANGLSVGDPTGVHFSVGMDEGALLGLWKGPFINVEQMWRGRGAHQTAQPMGSLIQMPAEPTLAFLENGQVSWPDAPQVQFQEVGYELDGEGRPTFTYKLGDVTVHDRLVPGKDGQRLHRKLTVAANQEVSKLWCRLAAGQQVQRLSDGSYSVDDDTYYLQPKDTGGEKPVVRQQDGYEELLVPVHFQNREATLSYTYIW